MQRLVEFFFIFFAIWLFILLIYLIYLAFLGIKKVKTVLGQRPNKALIAILLIAGAVLLNVVFGDWYFLEYRRERYGGRESPYLDLGVAYLYTHDPWPSIVIPSGLVLTAIGFLFWSKGVSQKGPG